MNDAASDQFIERPIIIGLALAIFFPLGLYFVWRHPTWSLKQKRIWTGGLAAYLLLVIVGSHREGTA